jgi:hypothetical protein
LYSIAVSSSPWPPSADATVNVDDRTGHPACLVRFKQAVLILRWFIDGTRPSQLVRDNALSTSTAYRYLHDEELTVLAAEAPDLATALERAKTAGLTHLNLDGTVIRTDRVAAPGPHGADLWWSGKHKHYGGNVQVIAAPTLPAPATTGSSML